MRMFISYDTKNRLLDKLYRGELEMLAKNKNAIIYSVITLFITSVMGEIVLFLFPNGVSIGSSILFIFMNLVPMITAIVFSIKNVECKNLFDFFRQSFFQKESLFSFILVLMIPFIYYEVSALLENVNYLNASIQTVLAYFPWTFLQGGLEEVGWRWYLQEHIHVKKDSFIFKMLLISIVWFLWHIPIYRLPWIVVGSSNYIIFYLMILGNTFTLGMLKEFSKGVIPCIISHMLIDTMAVMMLVKSSLIPIIILVVIEIVFSTLLVYFYKGKNQVL